jgi:hypothetical protein
MPYIGAATTGDPDISLKSVSTLYRYEYLSDMSHVEDVLISYRVKLGRMDSTGETVMVLIAIKNVKKHRVVSVTVPIIFK